MIERQAPICSAPDCSEDIDSRRVSRALGAGLALFEMTCSERCRQRKWAAAHPRIHEADRELLEDQLSLLDPPPPPPPESTAHRSPPAPEREEVVAERASIDERFEVWLAENPEAWAVIRRFAYEALRSGRNRFGIRAIMERVRWHINIETNGDETFKLNNDYNSRMARKLIAEEPRFDELFETRRLTEK
jgi:hypothetical protein